jgi:hypothetical protein
MADDDDVFSLDDLLPKAADPRDAATAGSSRQQPGATREGLAEERAEDARFAELVAGERDLFTHAADRIRSEADAQGDASGELPSLRIDWPEEARSEAERKAFDLLFELADQAERVGDAAARVEARAELADAHPDGRHLWPARESDSRDPRLTRDRLRERTMIAEAFVRQLGAAGRAAAEQVGAGYLQMPRLLQAALLVLAGDECSARRAAASSIVLVLPPLAERLVSWMEEPIGREAERQGLALAAILDRQAVFTDISSLSRLATEVLLVSLRAPLTRIVDMAPERLSEAAAQWAPAINERQVTPDRIVASPGAPLPAEAIARLRLLSAGITPLPFAEGRLSLAEPAKRVMVALASALQPGGPVRVREHPSYEIDAKLEAALFGMGLMLAGARPGHGLGNGPLVPVASEIGQQHLAGTVNGFEIRHRRKIDAVQRKRADEVKALKEDAANLLPRLAAARSALGKLGLDEDGKPLAAEEQEPGAAVEAPSLTVVVCPKIETKTNSKTREAVAGHEHMLGEPMPLAPVGDLPARRKQLMAEFPWATEVVDFILGDLVNRQAVTIRPVLLTGDPGSGKSHFARRFANVFGLHLWTTDCGGADGTVFSGTDRRWHSAEPSHPFLAMSRGRQANPLVLLDEIEKAPTRTDYGRIWDSLLPFLDGGSNAAAQDRCLQVPIDASNVNYIATANRVDPLPWPLRDRFRQIAFPEPGPEHLPQLVPPLLAQLADARGLDPRFVASLTVEDHAFIAQHWRGGSVRRLARLIEAIVNARERAMPVN